MTPHPTPSRATLALGLMTGIMAASTAAIFIRFAQAEGVPSITIAAARLSIAVAILSPYIFLRHRQDLKKLGARSWSLALLSGLFLSLHFASWITSLEYTTVASSVALVSTTPLWVALFAPLVVHERMGYLAAIGLFLALVGGAIIGVSDACAWVSGSIACPSTSAFFSGSAFLGDFLALFGAWMAAGYLLVGRKLRSSLPLMPYIFIVYGAAALILTGIMLIAGSSPFGYPPISYLWFGLLALVPQLLGHSTFNWALKYLPASFVSVTLLGEPIGSTILAYFVFRETPGIIKLMGAGLLLVGIWLAGGNDRKK